MVTRVTGAVEYAIAPLVTRLLSLSKIGRSARSCHTNALPMRQGLSMVAPLRDGPCSGSFRRLILMRNTLRKIVLRGPILDKWVLRRSRQIEQAYLRSLSEEHAAAPQAWPDPPLPALTRGREKLETILFIGDCMWEQDSMFPEWRKFASVQSLDLRPILQKHPESSPAEITARAIEEYARAPRSWEPDVILFYARPALLSEAAFASIRREWKCPLLGMNLDDRAQFFPCKVLASGDDDYGRWAAKFDVNLTNAYTSLDWYRRRGCVVRYFPPGFHLEEQYREPPARPDCDYPFSFLGSWKPERGVIIDELIRRGASISLFGKGWPKSQWVEKAAPIFRRSQINLGIGFALASARITTTKGRDIECPGVGACYLTTYNWELPMLYEIGKEILCYRDVEELVEMYGYYVKRPEECLKIAQAAHRRCVAEHTWEKRFRKLFLELGFET